jgi:hypothetical protein
VREQLQALIDQHGYQAVLNEFSVIMASKITPLTIGYDLVWEKGKDLNQLAFKMDRVRVGEAT